MEMTQNVPSQEEENYRSIQQQIAIRDLEVSLLRKELEEKKRVIQDLGAPHLMRERSLENEAQSLELDLEKSTFQLSQMQHELMTAEKMLHHYEEKETLLHEKLELTKKNARSMVVKKNMQILAALLLGFLGTRIINNNATTPAPSTIVSLNAKSDTETTTTEASLPLAEANEIEIADEPEPVPTSLSVPPDPLNEMIGSFFLGATETHLASYSLRNDNALPLVPASFGDIVTGKPPGVLPKRNVKNGIIGFSIGNAPNLSAELAINSVPYFDLCDKADSFVTQFSKLTLIVDSSSHAQSCLNNFISHTKFFNYQWKEINLIKVVKEPKRVATAYSKKSSFYYGEWSISWIENKFIGLNFASKLASAARAFGQTTDVFLQVQLGPSLFLFPSLAIVPRDLLQSGPVTLVGLDGKKHPLGKVDARTRALIFNPTPKTLTVIQEK